MALANQDVSWEQRGVGAAVGAVTGAVASIGAYLLPKIAEGAASLYQNPLEGAIAATVIGALLGTFYRDIRRQFDRAERTFNINPNNFPLTSVYLRNLTYNGQRVVTDDQIIQILAGSNANYRWDRRENPELHARLWTVGVRDQPNNPELTNALKGYTEALMSDRRMLGLEF